MLKSLWTDYFGTARASAPGPFPAFAQATFLDGRCVSRRYRRYLLKNSRVRAHASLAAVSS